MKTKGDKYLWYVNIPDKELTKGYTLDLYTLFSNWQNTSPIPIKEEDEQESSDSDEINQRSSLDSNYAPDDESFRLDEPVVKENYECRGKQSLYAKALELEDRLINSGRLGSVSELDFEDSFLVATPYESQRNSVIIPHKS